MLALRKCRFSRPRGPKPNVVDNFNLGTQLRTTILALRTVSLLPRCITYNIIQYVKEYVLCLNYWSLTDSSINVSIIDSHNQVLSKTSVLSSHVSERPPVSLDVVVVHALKHHSLGKIDHVRRLQTSVFHKRRVHTVTAETGGSPKQGPPKPAVLQSKSSCCDRRKWRFMILFSDQVTG